MKKIYILLVALFCLGIGQGKAQEEFFVKVNPATGKDSIISSLPDINYVFLYGNCAFDKKHSRYIFRGIDFNGYDHLYCVNATTGALISQPKDTSESMIGYLEYDNTNDTLYALYVDEWKADKTYLVSIDISTDAVHFITALPQMGFDGYGCAFLDQVSQTYVLQFGGSFYSINVRTGQLTTTPAPTTFEELMFDNTTSKVYGLVHPSAWVMLLADIDVNTGNYTTVDTMPTILSSDQDQTAFNEINHAYTFSNSNYLYSVSTVSNSVIWGPVFPVGMVAPENVIELQYDNSTGVLYALHWGTLDGAGINNLTSSSSSLNIYPNPSNGNFTLTYSLNSSGNVRTTLINELGQIVYDNTAQKSGGTITEQLNLENLATGIYSLRLQTDNSIMVRKLVVMGN